MIISCNRNVEVNKRQCVWKSVVMFWQKTYFNAVSLSEAMLTNTALNRCAFIMIYESNTTTFEIKMLELCKASLDRWWPLKLISWMIFKFGRFFFSHFYNDKNYYVRNGVWFALKLWIHDSCTRDIQGISNIERLVLWYDSFQQK